MQSECAANFTATLLSMDYFKGNKCHDEFSLGSESAFTVTI